MGFFQSLGPRNAVSGLAGKKQGRLEPKLHSHISLIFPKAGVTSNKMEPYPRNETTLSALAKSFSEWRLVLVLFYLDVGLDRN